MTNPNVSSMDKNLDRLQMKSGVAGSQFSADVAATSEAALSAVKSEVERLTQASKKAAEQLSAEVKRHPLAYTLVAAGAGALVGLGAMALAKRQRHVAH